ncbi:MAG: TonB-dependent receptor [Acidobacteria bacterium]|nr:TonB-dependent receptor [Acidobacteriota bacterium]
MSRNRIATFAVTTFAAGLLTIAGASVGQCQTASGSIVGTVKDSSGAVIPNANVTIVNQATNISQATVTDGSGEYSVPFLPVGVYTVRIVMTGFETMVRAGVVLRLGESVRVDVLLHPGRVGQEITVSGLAPLLQTENASTGQVIDNARILNLPLSGRNFLQLAQLTADVNEGAYGTYNKLENVTLAQKGISLSAQGQRDDSTSFMLDGSNVRGSYLGAITLVPSIDSIQEFKIQTTGYSARYGTSPVQLNVVSKAGTNDFHGSAYDFVRNTAFNARDVFAAERLPYHMNQFGGTIGGPVILPKLYNGRDRTFFFFSYEGTRNPVKSGALPSMPPVAMRNGDFSSLLPDTIIYDPNTGLPFTGNIIPKERLDPSMQALLQKLPEPTRPGLVNNYDGYSPANFDSNDYMARLDHRITDRDNVSARYARTGPSLLGEVPGAGGNPLQVSETTQGGYNLLVSEIHNFSPSVFNEFRYAYNTSLYLIGPQNAQDWGPTLNWQGLPHTIGVPLVTTGFGIVRDQTPGGYNQKINQFTDNVFIHKGAHSMTAGLDIFHKVTSPMLPLGYTSTLPYVWVVNSGAYTGYAFADYLLGLPALGAYFDQKSGYLSPPMEIRYPDFNFYFQDDWKVSPKFTLNLGVRYDLVPVLADTKGEMRNFDFQTMQLTPEGQVGNKYFQGAHKNFAPRVGFAYQLTDKTVIRGGYGWFYGRIVDVGPTSLSMNPPNAFSAIINNTTPVPIYTVENMFANVQPTSTTTTIQAISPTYTMTPSTQSWTFDLEHQLTPTTLLTLEYKGSLSTHLDGYVDVNTPTPGPGPLDPRRPYPGFQSIITQMSAFNATYHGAMVKLEKRMSHGVTFLGSYAWSKALDQTYGVASDGGEAGAVATVMDRTNFAREKGPSGMDIRNRAVFSFIYELPFGPGKAFASSTSSLVARLIEGWQFSGITTFQSGPPITIRTALDPANTGQTQQVPDVVCNPNNVPGGQSASMWFNTACYQDPTTYRYGDAGRGLVTSPGINNWDMALMKNFKIGERVALQLRGEFFNIFNHTQLGVPAFDMQEADFGVISTARSPRLGQVALKLLW